MNTQKTNKVKTVTEISFPVYVKMRKEMIENGLEYIENKYGMARTNLYFFIETVKTNDGFKRVISYSDGSKKIEY